MLRRVVVLVEILRPHNMLASALAAGAGYVVAGGGRAEPIATVAVLTALATGAGNVVNDVFDLPIDRINKPARPLPSGRLTVRAAVALYALCSAIVTAGAMTLAPAPVAALVVGWEVALLLYARWCRRWLVAGNLLVAAISSSAFLAGAMAAGKPAAAVVPTALGFAFVACREVVKGGEDVEGDRACGVRTLAVVLGRERAGRVAAALMLLLAALVPIPALTGAFRAGYFLLMETLVVPTLVLGALGVAEAADRRVFRRTSRALKLAMFAGIAAVTSGVY